MIVAFLSARIKERAPSSSISSRLLSTSCNSHFFHLVFPDYVSTPPFKIVSHSSEFRL
uniref:Uncharacterized protein n=1 Tax=Arundo donax TaxID=35708 RepID=A0A0A8Y4G6_ARUDO